MRNLFFKVISLVAIILLIASVGMAVSAYEYPDEGYWANEAIDAAIDNGLLRGKDDGKMHSEDNLTRAEMAAIMVRSFGATIEADISMYSDLKPSAWYYKDFAKAVQMRVFEGDGTGNMRPDDYITREEVFAVIARALVLNDTNYSALDKFNDKSQISDWAKGYMSILTQKSYVNGDDLGNANPKKNITRAEFAQLMHNIFRNYYSKADTYADFTNSRSTMVNVGDVTFKNATVNGDLVIGDGNAKGTIRLENVKIKGRLLVRGSNRVELVNTTVDEMVVVNNYNTVVHFDNYRDEAVFDDIILNTEATFKEKASEPVKPTPGGSGGGGTTTKTTSYKVEYYTQKLDLSGYTLNSQTTTTDVKVGTQVNAVIKDIEGFTYNASNPDNVITGVTVRNNVLTLKVYYDRNSYDYTVKYYQQNLDNPAKYDEVIADGYIKKALFEAEVTADSKTYTGFTINDSKSTKTGKIAANNNLLLQVYFDREVYTITFNGNGYTGTIPPVTVVYGQKISSLLPTLDRDGYLFDGWFVNGTEVDGSYVVTGPVEIKAEWIELAPTEAKYKVEYYIQDSSNLANYVKYDEKQFKGTIGETVNADTTRVIEHYTFDNANVGNKISGEVLADGSLVLKVYYNIKKYDYSVTYYTEKLDGTYEENTQVLSDVYGKEVSVVPVVNTGFELNTSKSTLSGIIDGNGNPTLKVYFDRKVLEYDVVYRTEKTDGTYEVRTETKSAKYGTEVVADYNVPTGFELGSSSVVSGTIPATGKLTLNVYYVRKSYSYTVKVYEQNDNDLTVYNEISSSTYTEKFGKTVSVTPDDKTGFDVNTTKSVLSGDINETNSLVLEIYYDREVYTITFNGNGYTGTIPSVTVAYGQSISTKLPSITRPGYVFDGWFVNGTEVDGSYTVTGPVELKAEWTELAPTEAIYKVEYYIEDSANTGLYIKYEEKQFKGTIGETVTADITKVITGYTYNASHGDNVLSGTVSASGDLVLKVYYDRASYSYKVTYYTEKTDGTYEERIETLSAKFGDYVSASTTVPTGFELGANSILGGYVNTDGSLELKVYYNRKEFDYKVIYYTEAVDGGYTGRTEVYSAKFGTTVTITPSPAYGFVTDEINSVLSGIVNENSSLELVVYYDRESYTIKFVAGQGLANPADETVYYNVPVTLPTLSKIDYEFKGWTDGTNVYSVGASAAFTSDVTLTAIWEYVPGQITYTVEYYVQNTDLTTYTMTSQPFNGTVGSTVTVTPEDKTGFDVNTAKSILSGTVDRANELVLKVYYDRESYTISFDAGAGVVSPADITAYYGVEVTLPNVAKDDYTFTGWSDGTYVYVGTTTFTADTALIAEWEYTPGQIAYTVEYYTQNTDLTTYSVTTESFNATSGTSVSIVPEEKTGFDINTANSVLSGTATSGLVLKVYYDRESYTISFDAGEGVENPDDITAYYGVEVTLPTLTKEGYRFDGWSDGVNTIFGNVLFTEPTSLTALWTELIDYVTVTFYDRGTQLVSVDVEKSTTVAESQFPTNSASYTGYVKDGSVADVYAAEPFEHVINYGWWYNPSSDKWEEFTSETVVTENTDVHLKINKFSTVITMADGMAFDFYAYYEPGTRFVDSIKDIIYKRAPLTALHQIKQLDKIRENGIVQKVLDTDDNIMMLNFMIKFSWIIGEENMETFIIDNAKEMFASGNNQLLHDAFVEYLMAVANSSNEADKKKVHDLMEETINHVFEEDTVSADTLALIKELCNDALSDPATFEEVTGVDYDSLSKDTRTFVVEYIIDELSKNDELFAEVVKEVTGVTYTDTTTTKDLIIAMAEKQLEESFDSTIDDIKDSQKNLIVETVNSMLTDNASGLYEEVLSYAVDNEKAVIVSTIKSLIETEDSLYETVVDYITGSTEYKPMLITTVKDLLTDNTSTMYDDVIDVVASEENYRAMVAQAIGTELATNDALFETLTGVDLAYITDQMRADAIDDLVADITVDQNEFENVITDAENAGYKSLITNSIVNELDTNSTFFDSVFAEAKDDYKDVIANKVTEEIGAVGNDALFEEVVGYAKDDYKGKIVDVIVDKLEEDNSPMYNKVIELAKTASYKQTITNAIIDTMNGANGDDMISAITGCTAAELAKDPQDKNGYIMNKAKDLLDDDAYFGDLMDAVTGKENYVLPATPKDFIIDMVVVELMDTESTSSTRDMIIEEAIAYLLAGQDQEDIEHLADYAIEYLSTHPEQRDEMVDAIINDVYKDEVDKLVYQLINEEQFEVTAETVFVAEGLKSVLLEDYNYETFFGSKIPDSMDRLFEIYPEEKIIELYDFALNSLIAQIDVAIAEALAGRTGYIDSGLTPYVNIVSDFYVPLYESFKKILEGKVEDKIGDNYYYAENPYLHELIDLLNPEVWVYGAPSAKPSEVTGYKIYDLDYYYDLYYKIYVLNDDAIMWYYENLYLEKYMEVTEKYKELILKYLNVMMDKIDAYATDGTIPDIHPQVNDKISAAEAAVMEKYPDLVKAAVDKYKSTGLFNRDFTEVDYDKVRDKIDEVFYRTIYFSTDDYFDIILNQSAYEDLEQLFRDKTEDLLDGKLDGEYYTKIDDNTFELEVNDYKVLFKRILTDA
ncbi:MAG: InlB B-repeat-containing protein [Clostridia bacterium]|nr:InlB B-repeat-containing protein [Clostridia bacterium]